MSISYSFGTLSAAIQAWQEITSADQAMNMADILQKGELRLYHALDLDNLDPIVSCGPVNGLTGIISKPSSLIRERTLSLIPPIAPSPVSLLLAFQGATGSTTFIDSTGNTIWTAQNGAAISASVTPFSGSGAGSLASPGPNSSGQYITTPSSVGFPLDVGSSNFTFEGWFYCAALSGQAIIMDFTNSFTESFRIYTNVSGANVQVTAQGFGGVLSGGSPSSLAVTATSLNGKWNHFAFVRNGLVFTMYLNGVPGNSYTSSSGSVGAASSGSYFIGGGYLSGAQDTYWVGNLADIRYSFSAVYTGQFTPPAAPFPVPVVPASGAASVLNKRSYEFVTQYLIDNGINQGPPKYFAEENQGSWQLAPLPDQLYTLNVRGIFRPTLLGDNPETTNLAGIAAAAHLVTITPMTLTASPFVYATNVPSLPSSQVWIYSAGNLSTNSFTIVGLDDDGNAQSEVVVGPSAGSVQSVGYYSSITSITPASTDSVQYASVGWSQDNQTWLSSRFGDLLFWYCMVEACQFNKRWSAAKEAEAEIAKLLPFAQLITRTLKRNDFDDLYSGRQNVGAPGAVPLPVPPQTGIQQGGAGQP